ncbi:penicillin acylase family protein [Pedobacter sp. P351]|uniref:penicillin acylase family protein n=1 Tax=Pedobacter superstes TaxID=3133441 RepID=UPI00309CDC9C
MRILLFLISAAFTITLIFLLNTSLTIGRNKTPRFGAFFSPQQGFWQNAEPATADFNESLSSDHIQGNVEVFFDDRLIPHIYAEKEDDAYFVQGYLHAKFRLWQMEFQTHVAAGRLSEIMGEGEAFLSKDRYFRRLGMVSGAEQSLKELEANSTTKNELDAYTNGVNFYIDKLKPRAYPLEYKLLDYKPERWTNLKTQLLLKYMAYDLAGYDSDFETTNTRTLFSHADFEKLYPTTQDSLSPIIPRGTSFRKPDHPPLKPANADSVLQTISDTKSSSNNIQPDINNGSNNWAVAGSKTKSGAPILCNDPHLNLNLPSLWFEMQISTPGFNSYGVSIPGSPSIIIGFNDNCAWGVTNAQRDVKDYYEIKFRDSTMQEYLFKGKWRRSSFRYEVIKVKGQADIKEKIAVTRLGPVIYDKTFSNVLKDGKYYAVRWMGQDKGNELLAFNRLNHAKNYKDFEEAIESYGCPAQNFVFASKEGDIGIKQQGKFPAKWQRQGDFLMPGSDSTYAWQGFIPSAENPSMHNPERGFVSSANQLAADSNYPYYFGGRPFVYRGLIINRLLSRMSDITVADMQKMQTDNYDVFAEEARPLLLNNVNTEGISASGKEYLNTLKNWNLRNDYDEPGPTIFDVWWRKLRKEVFNDDFLNTSLPVKMPDNSTLLEGLLKDKHFKFLNNRTTPATEDLNTIISASFKKACGQLDTIKQENNLAWGKYKNTELKHILSIPAFSRLSLPIGGGLNSINATAKNQGPGWRMIVQLSKKTEAHGVYAGGQSGNPGSKYYDNFVNTWAGGAYFKLLFLNRQQASAAKFKWKMNFKKA